MSTATQEKTPPASQTIQDQPPVPGDTSHTPPKETSNPPKARKKSKVPADHLRSTAEKFYIQLANGTLRGYQPEVVAEEAFRLAKAFCIVADRIGDGGELEVASKKQYEPVLVHVWDAKGKPRYDEETGKPITAEMRVDPDAFAPNLPKDHPINQRSAPVMEGRAEFSRN